jgi:hypothetical protein
MNERIDELFGQALDQAVPETWTTLNPAQLSKLKEKFSELMVQECATVIERNLFKGIGWNTSRAVKRHFGLDQVDE